MIAERAAEAFDLVFLDRVRRHARPKAFARKRDLESEFDPDGGKINLRPKPVFDRLKDGFRFPRILGETQSRGRDSGGVGVEILDRDPRYDPRRDDARRRVGKFR